MKLKNIIDLNESQQLDEISFKHAVAAGIGLVGGTMGAHHQQQAQQVEPQHQEVRQAVEQPPPPKEQKTVNPKLLPLINNITKRYNVDTDLATEIVELAHKYEKPTFPKAKDLIALIGVESAFNPNAISKLKRDPAVGLLQVRPKVWNLDPSELKTPEDQIKIGSDILNLYYKKLKNKDAAIKAYNIGITNYLDQDDLEMADASERYLAKYYNSLSHYTKT